MEAHLKSLLAAFSRTRESDPGDLASSLRSLPEPGSLLSPWNTWTMIGLLRHHKRQLWVAEIIRTRLRGDLQALADIGALGHPEGVAQNGPVPGMPVWEYDFHGRGCCFTHRVGGDAIDVDFWDDSADFFDTFFYKKYLESLRHPEPPEQRLRELHPAARAVSIAVTDLLAVGALNPLPGNESHPYRLADQVMARAEDIDFFCTAWTHVERRVWLAAVVGDWLAADAATNGNPELASITGPRAERCREIRCQRLRQDLGEQYRGADALQALADLQAPDLDQCLKDALRGKPSGLTSTALAIIGQRDDPNWCVYVHELYSRIDPGGQIPIPHIWITSLKFLLRHGHHTKEVISSLPKAGGTEVGEAVMLSLEYAPEMALPLIRKGLIADIPMDRTKVAAILALINSPWSKRELLRALEASNDQEKTADARAALLEIGDDGDQKAVLAWEKRNPHEREMGSYLEIGGRKLGPFYTFGEISLTNRASRITYEMDKLHEQVKKVKDIVPPEPPALRSWWRFWGS